ncbi:MAG: hypothetical protein LCH95_15465 [Proteobacteria bacterium]|nr:hypothetical protein [Pseudomonadota bacterium]
MIAGFAVTATALAQDTLPRAPTTAEVLQKGGRLVSGAELKQLLLGNTAHYVFLEDLYGFKRGSVTPVTHVDERSTVDKNGTKSIWWIDGDARCQPAADRSPTNCAFWYELAGTYYVCNREVQKCRTLARVTPGGMGR